MIKKITLCAIVGLMSHFGSAQCDADTVARFNLGDFPATSSSGVTITESGSNSGALGPYSPTGCSTASIEGGSFFLNGGNDVVLTFSQAVSEVSIALGVFDTGESGTVTTNNGVPTLSSNCGSADFVITNNTYSQVGARSNPVLKITIPAGATTVTITNTGNSLGGNATSTVDVLDCITVFTLGVGESDLLGAGSISVFPNPAQNEMQVTGLKQDEPYTIYNVLGAKVDSGIASDGTTINVQDLNNGVYFIKLNNGSTARFVKR